MRHPAPFRPPPRRRALALTLLGLLGGWSGASAQTLSVTGGWVLTTPALTETDYNATVSGATPSISVLTDCPAGPGPETCALMATYGGNAQGQQLALEVQVVAADPACTGVVFGSWQAVGSAPILTTRKNRHCSATLLFRVTNVSYSAYPAPGRLGTTDPYEQDLVLSFIRQ